MSQEDIELLKRTRRNKLLSRFDPSNDGFSGAYRPDTAPKHLGNQTLTSKCRAVNPKLPTFNPLIPKR